MKTKTVISLSLLLVLALNLVDQAAAANADNQGFEIAARADRSDVGFGESEVELTMILRNAAGQES